MTATTLALIAAHTPARVVTDPPAIVDLKRTFRELDEREQELKFELEQVREAKAMIATEIFNPKPQHHEPRP